MIGNRARYFCTQGKDNGETFWDVAINEWKLEKPRMIISVIGSATSLKLSPKIREKFGRGLVRAILSSNAWVITSGVNVGIAKEVGDAEMDSKFRTSALTGSKKCRFLVFSR